jgi:predicted metal-binding protein
MMSIVFNPKEDLIFDLKVIEACRNCKRYGKKASCPPICPSIDYFKQLLPTYKYGIFFYDTFLSSPEEWQIKGKESSLTMQKYLVNFRNELFNKGCIFVTAFGSGSCKICEQCEIPCRFPDKGLVPLEATGLNVVEILKKKGLDINFPVKGEFYRVGAIFYDE